MGDPPTIYQSVPGPGKLSLEGDAALNFRRFERGWKVYEVGSRVKEQDATIRASILQSYLTAEVLELLETLPFEDPDHRKDADRILKVLEAHFIGTTNETYERYKFNIRSQKKGETFDAFIGAIRVLSKSCNFGALEDSLLRDKIVCGVNKEHTRRKLLAESQLNLAKAINICKADESATQQASEIGKSTDTKEDSVHGVRTPRDLTHSQRPQRGPPPQQKPHKGQTPRQIRYCKFCGGAHAWKKESCPAYGKTCKKCKRKNHFAKYCKQGGNTHVHSVEEGYDYYEEPEYLIRQVSTVTGGHGRLCAELMVKDQPIAFQIDTGASNNLIGKKWIGDTHITPSTSTLVMWNGSRMEPHGECILKLVNHKNRTKYKVKFIVVNEDLTPLLGLNACTQMGLITINQDKFKRVNSVHSVCPTVAYKDVFEDKVGELPGVAHFEVDPSVSPVISPVRKVAIHMKPKMKEALDDLTKKAVIAPVNRPTDWLSHLVCTSKRNGELRMCLDPEHLNKALKREHFHLPVLREILPDLAHAKVFSTFDLRHGYWHVRLDDESSYMTTFDTPFGRYRWLRLPFGTSVSSEMFQRRLYQAIGDLRGILNIADDVLLYGVGKTKEEAMRDHDEKLVAFLQRCQAVGIRLNPKKMRLRLSQVGFMGHLVTDKGVLPDPDKVTAIRMMPAPTDLHGVHRLCGTVNFLSDFIPSLATIMEPINMLKRKHVEFKWGERQCKAFDKVKEILSNEQHLQYYDEKKPLTIQCDASQRGLGAALLQEGKPIAYASRALTKTEANYAQIEKELLAIVFSLEKFHHYTFARHVVVQSDHKPLETIIPGSLWKAPKRLQAMKLRLQKYDITVKYHKGKEMHIADTLSRAYPSDTGTDKQDDIVDVNVIQHISVSPERVKEIQLHTAKDETLQALRKAIVEGWPDLINELPPVVGRYASYRSELSFTDGIILRGDRIVVPQTLRKSMLEKLHSSHLGITGTRRRAAECLYWPNMNNDIKEFISQCETCRSMEVANAKMPLTPHDIPDRPWSKVGVDLFTLNNINYLILVDYFSGYFEVDELSQTLAINVIQKMKYHFARYGLPEVVVSDNGPQFSCLEFLNFSEKFDFKHQPSSPGNSQANGKAEAAVKTAKSIIKKAMASGRDVYLALLDLRNTPTQGQETSPAQRSLGRRTRTLLPTTTTLLRPEGILVGDIHRKILQRQETQKSYYDRKTKALKPLEEGDVVRLQPFVNRKAPWAKGQIIRRLDDRSYEVSSGNHTYRRNRVHLKATNEPPVTTCSPNIHVPVCAPSAPPVPRIPAKPKTPVKASPQLAQPRITVPPVPSPATPGALTTTSAPKADTSVKTRSGRTVNLPSHLKDFQMDVK